MDGSQSSPRLTAEFLLHVARLAQGEAPALTAAQWSALRYFEDAQPLSCTPSAFARFHGATRGTASQTIKTLVAAGLLARRRDPHDGRSVRFVVTPEGRRWLQADPIHRLERAIAAMPEDRRADLAAASRVLAGSVAAACGCLAFGICPDCAHLDTSASASGPHRCRSLNIVVPPEDLARLCAHFAPRDPAGASPA
jgi:DNA-binding MarR family transcriptional regulator